MARAIDADKVLKIFKKWIDTKQVEGEELRAVKTCIAVIEDMPTLTQPNEPLTMKQLREMVEAYRDGRCRNRPVC